MDEERWYWQGKVYFEWPYGWFTIKYGPGTVYEVDPQAVGSFSLVDLPDGTRLQLVWGEDDWLEVTQAPDQISPKGRITIYHAVPVFRTRSQEAYPEFGGDWDTILRMLNAAAATNCLFGVKLGQDDYQGLLAGEWQRLRNSMSPRAKSLVRLLEEDHTNAWDGPCIELYRTGRCP